jgi:hypothetical protein
MPPVKVGHIRWGLNTTCATSGYRLGEAMSIEEERDEVTGLTVAEMEAEAEDL